MVNDRQDVHMQYKSAATSNTQSWYFTDMSDSRFNITPSNTTTIDENNPNRMITGGGAVMDGGNNVVLMEIFTTSGYDETKVTQDHNAAKSQGFLMLPTDWLNFELGGYFEFMIANPNCRLELFGRSGKHVNGRPCEGIKYSIDITCDGVIRSAIKHWHSGGIEPLEQNSILGDIEGERIGIKFIVYNNHVNINNVTAVRIEVFIDRFADNNWEKYFEYTDTGEKTNYLKCGDTSTKMIKWGGPIVGLNIINFPIGGLAIDKLSVREIDALAPKVEIPIPAAPIDPDYVSPPTAPPSTGYRTDLDDDDWDDDLDYPIPPWGEPGDNAP